MEVLVFLGSCIALALLFITPGVAGWLMISAVNRSEARKVERIGREIMTKLNLQKGDIVALTYKIFDRYLKHDEYEIVELENADNFFTCEVTIRNKTTSEKEKVKLHDESEKFKVYPKIIPVRKSYERVINIEKPLVDSEFYKDFKSKGTEYCPCCDGPWIAKEMKDYYTENTIGTDHFTKCPYCDTEFVLEDWKETISPSNIEYVLKRIEEKKNENN